MKITQELYVAMVFVGIFAVIGTGYVANHWEETTQKAEVINAAPQNFIVTQHEPVDEIFSISSDGEMTFYKDGQKIGRLWHDDDNIFHFDGDADASAQSFFKAWQQTMRGGN